MKLLLDENLSARILGTLGGTFPGSQHVAEAGLRGRSDLEIWEFAKQAGFTIVSKDNDFRQLEFLYGPPPKVVWLNVGNAGTQEIATSCLPIAKPWRPSRTPRSRACWSWSAEPRRTADPDRWKGS